MATALVVRRAQATGRLSTMLRSDRPHRLGGRLDAWGDADAETRDETARRLLFARLRLNRAGLLRWRVIRSVRSEGQHA
jgi:hypothetical protein